MIALALPVASCPEALAAGQSIAREVVSLDGTWEILFDPDNAGREARWHTAGPFMAAENRETIRVPSCWEETRQDYEGVAWYSRQFAVPDAWKNGHVRLRFDAVNYRAEAWIDGQVVGRHEGGYGPFEFDVTGMLDFGRENRLTVRAVGPAVVKERVDDLVRNAAPHWRGAYVGGIWQSVKLIATPGVYAADVFVEPRLTEQAAAVHAKVVNATRKSVDAAVTVSVAPANQPDGVIARETSQITIQPGERTLSVSMPVDDPRPWTPDDPYLYAATVTVVGDGMRDGLSVRFGMREFTVKGGDFHLNGRRIFIKGAFWEGLYPSTAAHPRDLEIVRKEIRMAKAAGFNMLRPWRMPPAPEIIDLADEMGILLSGAPAVENMGYWPAETPQMESRWTRDMVAMVKRDRNHPSIILWETANEILRKSNLLARHRISLAARAADPTRLIIDESGGARAPWGSHGYLPYSSEPMPIDDRHTYRRSPVNEFDYHHLLTYGESGQLTFVSEVGYGGAPDLADNVARYREQGNPKMPDYRYHVRLLESLEGILTEHDLGRLFPDASALCKATQKLQADGNKLQLEALRINPDADGYCVHAFTAGDWVLGAGVLDIWRQPKLLYHTCAEVQRPLYLAIHATPQNVHAYRGTTLTVTAVNDGPAVEGQLTAALTNRDGTKRPLFDELVAVASGIRKVFERKLNTTGQSGTMTVTVELTADGRKIARNTYPIHVLNVDDLKSAAERVVVIEPQRKLRNYLEGRGVEYQRFVDGRDVTGPVIVAQPDAYTEPQVETFVRLMDWIERGGVAVWLKVPAAAEFHGQSIYRDPANNYMMQLRGQTKPWRLESSTLIDAEVFPLKLSRRTARGMWIPVGHYTRRHQIFDGLPSECFMAQPYQNVAATDTLTNLPGRAIAGSVSWDIQRDYRGPTEWWHGTDLAVVPHGEGKLVLSMLRVVEHVGKDPVADRLFENMIRFAHAERRPIAGSSENLDRRIEKAVKQYRALREKQE